MYWPVHEQSIQRDGGRREQTMKNVFANLAADFLSTILFLAIFIATDNLLLATGIAIVAAIAR